MHQGQKIIAEVSAALGRSDFARAADLALRALGSGMLHPLLLNVRAQSLENQGRDAEALADLESAIAMAPDDAGIQEALGLVLLRLGRAKRARGIFEGMTKRAPKNADAHFNVGTACEALGDLDNADRWFRAADALKPGRVDTLSHIAALAARRAEWSEARLYADRALAKSARAFDAVFAHVMADMGTGDYSEAAARLTPILDDTGAPTLVRATASSLLADALDAQGKYNEAFRGYEAASALYITGFSARYGASGSASAYVKRLCDIFQEIAWNAAPPESDEEQECVAHVFAIGFPRSGTTLLERILTAHPEIVSTEEHEHLGDAAAMFLNDRAAVDRLNALSLAGLNSWRREYWKSVREAGVEPRGKVFVDKLPLNTIKLPLISRLFPMAKVVFSVRDPRDVVLSCYRRRFAMTPSMFELLTLAGAARFYASVMELFELYSAKLPIAPYFVRYETLVEDFEAETRRICGFLGLPWTERLREFSNATGRSSSTPSATQVKRGLYASGADHWRHYESRLEPVLPVMAPWIARWDYPL